MNYIDCLMPKPVPAGKSELEALVSTMEQMRNLIPNTIPDKHRNDLTAFLEVAPYILMTGFANRGMLRTLVAFGQQVNSESNFIPWLNLQPYVSLWLPWAETRLSGELGDYIDKAASSVELAVQMLPVLATDYPDVKRRDYHNEVPPEFAAWCVYSEKLGFCVFAIPSTCNIRVLSHVDAVNHIELLPVKAVLAAGWGLQGGFLKCKGELDVEAMQSDKWLEYEKGD
ncbi:hypothetical protein MKR81_27025 (plasmid) [Vibrio campbellii]|uniref:hypothetical protein n=1 Tax=Vibrio campbellii TaxID=680 RepID=UPI001F0716FE|nr:hypothetical protein [Vibrio campbellii]UMM06604.1 hypothetical protein MKR81_27025 [Vibrio campbellii]